ncbi:MAG: NADH-quinone oxidoreductase subunit K [Candidatus Nezhaarchaeota archaeon]|nr:NADH-quinone oxidoreductase subunit K [Candidatus Nezhaarchaeota archaeon]
MALGTTWYVAAGLVLFAIGTYCLVVKRNVVKLVIGLEIVTSAMHLNFIALGYSSPVAINPLTQVVVVVSIVLGACVATVALMYVINVYRHYGSLDVRKLKRLRW